MLEINNIVKRYSDHLALDDISMNIPAGKIFGLLGPNGAGKTSLIRIINQITAPDSGYILFDGEPLSQKHIAQIGYLPEERGLYKKMEVGEQMIYLAQLKGLSKQQAKERLGYWFEKLQMNDWWKKKIEDLSKGMQQKVQFISTVLHEPELIILDEPFSGFDPLNAQVIQDEILKLNREGATIIYSTHRMETVEELCDHIALINKSKKILDGAVKDIKKRHKSHIYQIDYTPLENADPNWIQSGPFEVIALTEGRETTQLKIRLNENIRLNELIMHIIDKVNIIQIKEILPSIHDIFIEQVTQSQPTSYA
ncbi:MAG TPA: ABC transporter ATP-binding protein [Sphingobacterium sp.]|nr:ABC transporter ATP-binding protein [Sphingobacterium sp.]